MGTRTGKPRAAALVAGATALVLAAFALLTNLASSLVPLPWLRAHAVWVWLAVGGLALVSIVLGVVAARNGPGEAASAVAIEGSSGPIYIGPHTTYNVTPRPHVEPVRSGQIVVGELPSAPPVYVDRAAQDDLRTTLRDQRIAIVCALTGGRGVGKTQVAAAYARSRAMEGCPLVAWVSAASRDTLLAGLAEVSRAVGVADPEGDSEKSAMNLRHALEARSEPALLVLDNATDADDLARILPAVGPAEVVVTSTEQAFAALGKPVRVGSFTESEARRYLAERTGRPVGPDADAVRIALGDLPLALAQAVTVMELQGLDYAGYLDRLKTAPVASMLTRHPGDPYPQGAAEAILLSVQAVGANDSTGWTQTTLEVLAFLSPDGVPRSLLFDLVSVLDAHTDTPSLTSPVFDETVERLVALSVLSWGESGSTVVIHRLVARVVRDRLRDVDTFPARFQSVVTAIREHEIPPGVWWANRELGNSIVLQLTALWDHAMDAADAAILSAEDVAVAAARLRWAVGYLTGTADLPRAILLGKRVMVDCERLLGTDHPDTLTARSKLAGVYQDSGRLTEAIPLFEQNRDDCERLLGTDHPDTLAARNNLAGVYQAAGRLTAAIPLFEQNRDDCERLLSTDHPHTLTARSNLASAYHAAERLTEAIPLFEQNRDDCERLLGTDHPDTLAARNNLGGVYHAAGRLTEAIPLFEQNRDDCERLLGTDHPHTLTARGNLAGVYQAAGRLTEAILLYEQNRDDRARLLGTDHPDTLTARGNLASAYHAAERLTEAILLYEQNRDDCERLLSTDHPHTLTARNNLASAYQDAGQLTKAINLYEQNRDDSERLLGPDHPATLSARNNLAGAYLAAGRNADGEPLRRDRSDKDAKL